jgi:hypothetical protein
VTTRPNTVGNLPRVSGSRSLHVLFTEVARSLLFLSPVSANLPSPPADSDTAARMEASPQEPNLTSEQRRALTLLASFRRGMFEDLLVVAHEFDRAMIAGLVEAGLATAWREIVTAPGHTTIEVVRIRISDAGRRALEG